MSNHKSKTFLRMILMLVFALFMVDTANAAIPSNCASFNLNVYQCVRARNGTWWTVGNNWPATSALYIPACAYVPEIGISPAIVPAHYVVGARLAASEYYHSTMYTWYCGNDANHYTELWGRK